MEWTNGQCDQVELFAKRQQCREAPASCLALSISLLLTHREMNGNECKLDCMFIDKHAPSLSTCPSDTLTYAKYENFTHSQ